MAYPINKNFDEAYKDVSSGPSLIGGMNLVGAPAISNHVDRRHTQTQERYAAETSARLGWEPTPGRFHLFRLQIDDVTFVRYDEPTGDQYVTRWPQGREFVRRGTSATSLGEPEPRVDLLGPG